jgi:hypothetical protein
VRYSHIIHGVDFDYWFPRKCCLLLHRPKVIKGIYAGQILKTE